MTTAGDRDRQVSIIVPVYNQMAYTEACFASIVAHTPQHYRLIVIDNASTDGTAAFLRQCQASDLALDVITNDGNLGFTAAANQGLKLAETPYALLLNNDTTVTAGWLEGLLLTAEGDEGIGCRWRSKREAELEAA